MEKVLVLLCLISHSVFTFNNRDNCKPGKITGISCPSSKDIVEDYQLPISNLQNRIKEIHTKTINDITSTRILIGENIQNARNSTNQKLNKIKQILNLAISEAARAKPKVKSCIRTQNANLLKIRPSNFLQCSGNFTTVIILKKEIEQLQKFAFEIVQLCTKINPFESIDLKMCLDSKIINTELQVKLLNQDFEKNVRNLIKFSTDCIVENSGRMYAKIGSIEGAIKNCKDVR